MVERVVTLAGEKLIVVPRDEWLAELERLAEMERQVDALWDQVAQTEELKHRMRRLLGD